MNTVLTIIGLSVLIFLVVFYLKRTKEKRKALLEEQETIKAYEKKKKEGRE
jgi:LPXTG-motif cell wall-anchored protein|tara:strand:- start:250 stop:402 length:153 start_codon:yes stop_codon:yes gene_type:complete